MILAYQRTLVLGVMSGVAALGACSHENKESTTETTAAKVESARADAIERLDQSAQLVNDFGGQISDQTKSNAQCVIAVPSLKKGGLVIGAEGGSGYASCQTQKGWSAPAPITMTGGTFGAQIGYQSADVLALVDSAKGRRALESGNFRVGADASAAAGPVGTGRGSATADLATYSRSKGLYAGAELNGATITADDDATRAPYGSPHSLIAILGGKVARPKDPAAERFEASLSTFGQRRGVAAR